ncbi:MAG: hypothetical protein CO028_02380 [Candidatus Levybacteria bacterium CG_4_9_14_0_2_um_filter_35_21]|nr:MAG: hypothetical protein CO028_02380 [Candidatus Levybacteria bacterium CG_4_9_14_0_2_um_filter_35_21]
MITDLKNSIVFLHGLSGSGKGEIQRKLAEQYSSHGYDTVYVSSGALFRAALSNPVIAEQVRRGYFLDTLGAIMPGIESTFEHFVKRWVESDGKAVMILDGVIRRGAFINKDGVAISSQIEQISLGVHNVIKKLVSENRALVKHFPEYDISNNRSDEELIAGAKQMMKEATHIVADVLPEDAEAQMKRRADKEIYSIRGQLQDRVLERQLDADKMQEMESYIFRLEAVLHGGIKKEGDGLAYVSRTEWNDSMDKDLYPLAASEVRQIREDIARTVGLENSAPLTSSLESIGVFTELRDDDISPIGRRARIDNYIITEEKEGRRLFEAGFATQALSKDLGFQFTPDGSFRSETRNCIAVTNGQSKGIGLVQFQTKCEFMAARLYGETESRREIIFGGKEGQRINREQEI